MKIGDVLQMQAEIAAGIARALQVTINNDDLERRGALRSPEAYNLYLQGRHMLDRYDQTGTEEAAANFQQALKLDPQFAPAAEWLAWTFILQSEFDFVPPSGLERARDAANLALRLDPSSALAHSALGLIAIEYDRNWATGQLEVQQTLALEPRRLFGLFDASNLASAFGRWDEAVRFANAAIAESPLEASLRFRLGMIRLRCGRIAEANAAFAKTLEISPTFTGAHFELSVVHLLRGEPELALVEMERESEFGGREAGLALVYHALGRKLDSDRALVRAESWYGTISAFTVAEVCAFRGESDRAFAWLERAYTQKDLQLFQIKGNRLLKSLEPDPRYAAFLHKLNLPQ
jgi:hypothetical protein